MNSATKFIAFSMEVDRAFRIRGTEECFLQVRKRIVVTPKPKRLRRRSRLGLNSGLGWGGGGEGYSAQVLERVLGVRFCGCKGVWV